MNSEMYDKHGHELHVNDTIIGYDRVHCKITALWAGDVHYWHPVLHITFYCPPCETTKLYADNHTWRHDDPEPRKRQYINRRYPRLDRQRETILEAFTDLGAPPLRVIDLGHMCNIFTAPVKTMCQWLEAEGVLNAGAYERLANRGMKAKEVIEAAKAERDRHGTK